MNNQKRVLIVEDENPMARALVLKLKKEGFDAKKVPNGKEAVEMLVKESFDLVLLDLIMPERDGFFVLEQIKEREIDTKVIVASNLSQPEDVEKAKNMGAIDYFVKSDTPIVEVVERVKKQIG